MAADAYRFVLGHHGRSTKGAVVDKCVAVHCFMFVRLFIALLMMMTTTSKYNTDNNNDDGKNGNDGNDDDDDDDMYSFVVMMMDCDD